MKRYEVKEQGQGCRLTNDLGYRLYSGFQLDRNGDHQVATKQRSSLTHLEIMHRSQRSMWPLVLVKRPALG